jgi:hypothetical protein
MASVGTWHGKLTLFSQNIIGHQAITIDHKTGDTYAQFKRGKSAK